MSWANGSHETAPNTFSRYSNVEKPDGGDGTEESASSHRSTEMKKGIRYIPPLVIALALTIAGSPAVLNIPATFFWAGVIASVLIFVLGIKDLMHP